MRGEQAKQADLSQRIQAEARATASVSSRAILAPIISSSLFGARARACQTRKSPGQHSGNQRHHVGEDGGSRSEAAGTPVERPGT